MEANYNISALRKRASTFMLKRLISSLRYLIGAGRDAQVLSDIPPKTVVPLLIYPRGMDDVPLGQEVSVGGHRYFMSGNVEVPQQKLRNAIASAEAWLNGVLGSDRPLDKPDRIEFTASLGQMAKTAYWSTEAGDQRRRPSVDEGLRLLGLRSGHGRLRRRHKL